MTTNLLPVCPDTLNNYCCIHELGAKGAVISGGHTAKLASQHGALGPGGRHMHTGREEADSLKNDALASNDS